MHLNVHPVHLPELPGLQQLLGRAAEHPATRNNANLGCKASDQIQIVRCQDDRQSLRFVPLLDNRHQPFLGREIHRTRRLVQYQDVRLGGQGAGEKDSLLLPTGQFLKRRCGELRELYVVKASQGGLLIRGSGTPARSEQPIPAHENDIQHGQGKERINRLFLWHVAEHNPGSGLRRVDPPLSTLRLYETQQPAKKRCFPGSIRAHETNEFPRVQPELDISQDNGASVTEARIP